MWLWPVGGSGNVRTAFFCALGTGTYYYMDNIDERNKQINLTYNERYNLS